MANRLVSAVMPTWNRRRFLPHAIDCFLQQSYEPKELVILDSDGSAADLIPSDPRIRYFSIDEPLALGEKQNLGCRLARGETVFHWDDDDWYGPGRMEDQLGVLEGCQRAITGYRTIHFFDERSQKCWIYRGPKDSCCGTSLCYRKRFWSAHVFPPINLGHDSYMILNASRIGQLVATDGATQVVARRHRRNTSPLFVFDPCFHEVSFETLPIGFRRICRPC